MWSSSWSRVQRRLHGASGNSQGPACLVPPSGGWPLHVPSCECLLVSLSQSNSASPDPVSLSRTPTHHRVMIRHQKANGCVHPGPFPSHLELIRGAVDLGLELGDDTRFTLHYERLERGPGGSESRPVEVACALTRCIKGGRPSVQGDLDARLVAVSLVSP